MRLPDCRKDPYYNEKYLTGNNRDFVDGYDWAVKEAKTFFDNLDVYPEAEELLEDNTAVIKEGKVTIMAEALADWMEHSRDELITSMIDDMDDYYDVKKKVDGNENELQTSIGI